MLLPRGREILPEHPDSCSGRNAASESAALFMEAQRRSDRLRAAMGCGHAPGVSRAVPHYGERPCRTRRLRCPPQQGMRPGRIPTSCGKTREILPPDASRHTPGQAIVRRPWGGEVKDPSCPAVANALKFSMNRLSFASASTGLLLLPGRVAASRTVSLGNEHLSFLLLIPVEIDTNENEFQCQLKSGPFSLFLKNIFN